MPLKTVTVIWHEILPAQVLDSLLPEPRVLHLLFRVLAESFLFQVRREPVCHYRVCVPSKRLVIVSVNRSVELTIFVSYIDCMPWMNCHV